MIPSTFTGTSRPRRQVNLSGRTSNPFASASNRSPSSPAHNAVAHAQQERVQRQRERERPPAATTIQRVWRGHRQRSIVKNEWREEFDLEEAGHYNKEPYDPYESDAVCMQQLRLLVHFAFPRNLSDRDRLNHFANRFLISSLSGCATPGRPSEPWLTLLALLARLTLRMLSQTNPLNPHLAPFSCFLNLLKSLAHSIPVQISGVDYFDAMALVLCFGPKDELKDTRRVEVLDAVRALLESSRIKLPHKSQNQGLGPLRAAITAYVGFAWRFLTSSHVLVLDMESISGILDYGMLTSAIEAGLANLSKMGSHPMLWLLAHYLRFGRQSLSKEPSVSQIKVISRLVSFCAPDIESGRHNAWSIDHHGTKLPPPFVEQEILSLVNQDSVTQLLGYLEESTGSKTSEATEEASSLATYVLTLLRVFPRRADDIRMWLFMGGARKSSGRDRLPAVKFFYESIRRSTVFISISQEPREAINLLKPDLHLQNSYQRKPDSPTKTREREWRIVLLFMELYKFVMMVMDDEEFLSGSLPANSNQSWTRQSALPVDQIAELIQFLKHLAFSIYWHGSEITGIEKEETKEGLSHYFSTQSHHRFAEQTASLPKREDPSLAGMPGMTLSHLKGMVTGLLRMIYERDSRRKFLPTGHWLMTKYFEMDRFIAAVVEEEEWRKSIGDLETQSEEAEESEYRDEGSGEENLIGTSRTQRLRHAERLKEQQQQMARKRELDLITPRLEIMQNMPFFIPFATRVQIFRQFVRNEQRERRGFDDPDDWRFAMMQAHTQDMSKHRATVRRQSIFDDAYEQFYTLNEGLKEPIQIKFVDKFGTEEEGIDGGGVTKEFLTSITNEAFSSNSDNLDLFIENDQHLLFPNPSAVDERRDLLTQAGLKESHIEWTESVRDLLRRYEFLGRIIGKCMYEGILVDVPFAGFFLLKWALTGGGGAASRESSYRANLNDLRDLDEGLYQGLLQLKNYPGNVEDFSLNFTIEDAIEERRRDKTAAASTTSRNRTVTRELRPGGSSISVTNENRLVYISLVARHRLQYQPRLQTSAFLRGLGQIVSPSWLSMFNQSELQTLISGSRGEIDVSDLRRNTQYGGVYAIGDDGQEHPTVQYFWKALELMSDSDRRKVLKFVTSTPRAPLLGFDQLNPRFSIRDSGGDQTRLPTTSTCVNLLKLPIYQSLGVLKERLLYSVNAGAGFNLS